MKDKLLIIYNTCLNPKNALLRYINLENEYEKDEYGDELNTFNLFNLWGVLLALCVVTYAVIVYIMLLVGCILAYPIKKITIKKGNTHKKHIIFSMFKNKGVK
jgi:hypothetical protein